MDENMTTTAPETTDEHGTITELFIQFWIEVFKFFKYIFYDIYLGE